MTATTTGSTRSEFADGTIWTHADLFAQAMLNNGGNDTFYGGPEADTHHRRSRQRHADRASTGMTGSSAAPATTCSGARPASDTYVFGRGDGQDVIVDSMGRYHRGGIDTVELGADIAPGDITVSSRATT